MSAKKKTEAAKQKNGANLGFEQKLWQVAEKLRGNTFGWVPCNGIPELVKNFHYAWGKKP